MRKLLLFFMSVAMIVGGLYWLGVELLFAHRIYSKLVGGGVMLVFLGSYLLWIDFVAPRLGIKTGEE
jgi:hypothetical protein